MTRLFISHASTDSAFARALVAQLESRGVACWIAPRDIAAGENYAGAIERAISDCSDCLVLWSAAASASEHVASEIERAAHYRRARFLVRLESLPPSKQTALFLSSNQWLDWFALAPEEALEKLLAAIALGAKSHSSESIDKPQAPSVLKPPSQAKKIAPALVLALLCIVALFIVKPWRAKEAKGKQASVETREPQPRVKPANGSEPPPLLATPEASYARMQQLLSSKASVSELRELLSERTRATITEPQWEAMVANTRLALQGSDSELVRVFESALSPRASGLQIKAHMLGSERAHGLGWICDLAFLSQHGAAWQIDAFNVWPSERPCLRPDDIARAVEVSKRIVEQLQSNAELEWASRMRPNVALPAFEPTMAQLRQLLHGQSVKQTAAWPFGMLSMSMNSPYGRFVAVRFALDALVPGNLDLAIELEPDGEWRLAEFPRVYPIQ